MFDHKLIEVTCLLIIYTFFIFSENLDPISEYLPKTIDELLDLNIDLPEYPRFKQCTSKSLPYTGNNSQLPVFIIPGLGVSRVQSLINKIMHPVYCAKFPSYINSVENAALGLIWVPNYFILNLEMFVSTAIIYLAFETNSIGRTVYDRRRNMGRKHCSRTCKDNGRIWRNRHSYINGWLSV